MDFAAATCDDVDDGQLGVSAVHGRSRAADDLDALDLVHGIVISELQRRVEELVHHDAVEEQERFSFVRPVAAEPDVHDSADVERERETRNEREHVDEIARADGLDLLARDERDDARRFARAGASLRGDADRDVEQLFERHVVEGFSRVPRRRGTRGGGG